MAILEILKLPDPRLKEVAEDVVHFDRELHRFVADLEETRQAGPAAVGIAAPQAGRWQRIIIIDCSTTGKPVPNHGRLILVNPEITDWDGFALGREGCLSVPDYTGNVIRAARIKLRAHDPRGELQAYEMEGFEARALQHEVDHLDGILFIDRLVSRRTDLFQRKVYQKGGNRKKQV
ncbi:MAG: peptide deformylase [Candidatus Thiodiazotropha sp. (ex Epidulcina cf. delphinae)]|nr:peptide deformylase [Candidatus Thiodiazotropha sp. (ex Epidulcina cf. delphinae)]